MTGKGLRWTLAVAGAAILVAWTILGSNGDKKPVPPPPGAPPLIAATGRIECIQEAFVHSKVFGRVVRYAKKEGDWAEKGEPVVLLDDGMERAALGEAEAELFRAGAAYKRLQPLREGAVTSAKDLDDADAAQRLAQARVERAKAALEERTVRAPFSGRILRTHLEEGEMASPESVEPLFVIGDDRKLKVIAEVDELDIDRLLVGSSTRILPDAYPSESYEGTLVRVGRMLGRKTITSDNPAERMDAKVLEIEIEMAPAAKLKRGLSVQVKIQPGK